jgi:uncharacterized protein (UPF0303 family)
MVVKDYHPFDTLFSVQGGIFPPPTKIKNVITISIASVLKRLEDHLLRLKDFPQMVGNIYNAFRLATTKKAFVEEMM